ncbi:metal-dependent peptidase [Anoxybacillus flavithermus]|nr:metal-dependent peptidase [Anoxybacillus flavithermus]
MEIRGYGHYRSASSPSTTVTLKAGDVYEAVVKEQVGEKEAIVQLRGVDIRFRFEGDVPPSGRVRVQVTGGDGDVVEGKVVTPPPASSFEKFETPELRQAAMIVTQKQLPLTRETVESLRTFLTEGKGTVEQKLETIQIAATKKLDMTIKQLQAVHEALHGKPFSESLHDIVQAIDKHFSFTPIVKQQSQTVSELRAQLQQERNMDRVLELAKQFAEENGHDEIAKAVREATFLKERGHETFARSRIMQAVAMAEVNEKIDHGQMERAATNAATKEKQLQMVRQQVEREPIVAKALTIAKGSEVVRQTLGTALQEAEQLYRSGQPLSAKERLLEAFASVEEKDNVPAQPSSTMQKQMVDEAKRIVRNARSIEDAVRQLKETVLPRIEANELHEAIERVEQLGEKAKTDLIQALRAVGQKVEVETKESLRTNAPMAKVDVQEGKLKQVIEVRKQVEHAPTVKAVEAQVRELARTLPAEQGEKVVRALEQSKQQETVGRSVEARQQLMQALRAVEEDTIADVVRTAKEAVRANTPATAVETKEGQLKQVVDVRKQVESTPTVKAVEPQVRELARTLPAEQGEKVVRALEQSKQQETMGRSVEARQQLMQALRAVEEDTVADVVRTAKEAVRANTPATKVDVQEGQLKQVVEVRKQVEHTPTVKAVELQVRELARTLRAEQGEKVVRALEQSKQQETMGRSVEARQQLMQALRAVEEDAIADVVRTAKEAVRANTPATKVDVQEGQLKQVVEVRKQVEHAPTVKAVEAQVRELARTLPAEQGEKVVRALEQSKQQETVGRSVEARQQLSQTLRVVEEDAIADVVRTAKEAVRASTPVTKVDVQEGQLKQVVEVRKQVEHTPTVKAVEGQVRELARTLPAEQGEKVVRALEQSKQQETVGRSVEARQQLMQALRAVEEDTVADVVRTAKEAVRANTPATKVDVQEGQLKQVVEVRKQVEHTPTVKAVEVQVRELARTLPAEQGEKVVRALSQAKLFETVGRDVEARQPLVQALQSIEQQLAPEYMNRANMIADRLEQQTMTLTEAVRQLQADAMLTKRPNMPQTLQQIAQMLDKQREQLFTAIATIENEQRATNDVRALIAQAMKTMQKEPNVKEALQMVRAQLARHTEPSLHKALTRADELAENGREMAARQTVVQALQQIELTLPTNDASSPADAAYESLAALGLQSKDMIVQTVTKRMAEAAKQFQQTKRDMMRNLDAIDHLIAQYKQAARPQTKQLLETTIKQLDQTILKSDAMLFADMTMEKKLLQASSQLAEAKKLLDKGKMTEAQKIVKQVKSTLEQMQFKPSDVKVKHFVQAQSLKKQTPEQALLTQWNEIVQPEPSARHMLQTIQRLGFMHEADTVNALAFRGESEQSEETMKGLLMQLAQTGGEGSKQAEQAAVNITGQQLLNKNDQGSAMQTLFFTIPLLLQKEVKDVKVYVNARNDGKRVDWENCSLYFLLETKKLGDVGVLLSANERTISVTFRNDREDFAERMRPLVETATKRLEEIGYRVGNVQFTTFEKTEEKTNEPKRATWTEKGYDFTI